MKIEVTIKGRIDSSEVHNGKTFTILTTPSKDDFSHPSRFKVSSAQPLGSPGQIVECKLDVTGMVREKSYRDRNTGEQKKFNDATVLLHVESVRAVPTATPQAVKAG